jgi:pimeloyl-ACP methyl ester carboxylesterase
LDISWCRDGERNGEVPEESSLPWGFTSLRAPEELGTAARAYAAFVVTLPWQGAAAGVSASWAASKGRGKGGKHAQQLPSRVVVVSNRIRMGPKIGKKGRASKWSVDLIKPVTPEVCQAWRSLAIPLCGGDAAQGSELDFALHVQYAGSEDLTEVARVSLKVPPAGYVQVVTAEFPPGQPAGQWAEPEWIEPSDSQTVLLTEFAGSGQINTLGGVQLLRGRQCPLQFATEEIMLSFLLYVPEFEEPAPLLLFFHGDNARETSLCPMPGLADFADTYGPAEVCQSRKKADHEARRFVVVTPCSPAEYWWFRYPAVHDSGSYVPAMERWVRALAQWTEVLGLTSPKICGGLRLVGQSMGGYAALELARAMPDEVAAIGCGAPCFDAFRLDRLAQRIQNIPLWILIGRQDTMCAFEEAASLALRLRDINARFVRLSSLGIRAHSDACKQLDKAFLFRWLLNPLGDG